MTHHGYMLVIVKFDTQSESVQCVITLYKNNSLSFFRVNKLLCSYTRHMKSWKWISWKKRHPTALASFLISLISNFQWGIITTMQWGIKTFYWFWIINSSKIWKYVILYYLLASINYQTILDLLCHCSIRVYANNTQLWLSIKIVNFK